MTVNDEPDELERTLKETVVTYSKELHLYFLEMLWKSMKIPDTIISLLIQIMLCLLRKFHNV